MTKRCDELRVHILFWKIRVHILWWQGEQANVEDRRSKLNENFEGSLSHFLNSRSHFLTNIKSKHKLSFSRFFLSNLKAVFGMRKEIHGKWFPMAFPMGRKMQNSSLMFGSSGKVGNITFRNIMGILIVNEDLFVVKRDQLMVVFL